MILPVMCLNFQWLQMSLCNLCLLSVRSLVLRILPCIPQCFHLLHVVSFRSIWKTLWTSLQVSIPHPRHHSSWTGTLLPFLLGYFFIAWKALHQWCRLTVSHNYTVSVISSLKASSYYSSSWILSWTIITCSSEQVSSFFSCRRLYAIFPTSQMH